MSSCVHASEAEHKWLTEMLSDMRNKLSRAVKLYDQLLTEQVAHPRSQSPQPVTNAPYQQANSRDSLCPSLIQSSGRFRTLTSLHFQFPDSSARRPFTSIPSPKSSSFLDRSTLKLRPSPLMPTLPLTEFLSCPLLQ